MGGRGRHFNASDNLFGHDGKARFHDGHRGLHGHGAERRGRGGRLFDYGELRTLVLALISEAPRHGYELIKAIEERFAGAYTPSPGVIYPTLSWLNDMGYADVEAEQGGRKRYVISAEGEAFLAVNRTAADDLLARASQAGDGPRGRHGVPAPVLRAMENLKLALRLRLREGEVGADELQRIAAAIDAAAQAIERG